MITIKKYKDDFLLPQTFLMYDRKGVYFGHRRKDNVAWRVRWLWFARPLLETFNADHVRHEWNFTGERPVYHRVRWFGLVDHTYATFIKDPDWGVVPGTGAPPVPGQVRVPDVMVEHHTPEDVAAWTAHYGKQ